MIKEHPILFSTDMVQVLLPKRKTKTRRSTGLDEINQNPDRWKVSYMGHHWTKGKGKQEDCFWIMFSDKRDPEIRVSVKCPYGDTGDLLWVRESYTTLEPEHCEGMDKRFYYKADHHEANEEWRLECIENGYLYKWKPSIHMPKHVSRIWLEIIDIKIERAQDITDEDAVKEGVLVIQNDAGGPLYRNYLFDKVAEIWPRDSFASLWKKINGAESWELNPWVWVIEFKQIKK